MIASDSPLSRELSEEFGCTVRMPNGGIDRSALSRLVFADGKLGDGRRAKLNAITHRVILAEARRWLDAKVQEGAVAATVNAPLLFESGFHKECDITVSVIADDSVRIARICARDGVDEDVARKRITAQHDSAFLIAHTDLQVYNNGTYEELLASVRELSSTIYKILEEKNNAN